MIWGLQGDGITWDYIAMYGFLGKSFGFWGTQNFEADEYWANQAPPSVMLDAIYLWPSSFEDQSVVVHLLASKLPWNRPVLSPTVLKPGSAKAISEAPGPCFKRWGGIGASFTSRVGSLQWGVTSHQPTSANGTSLDPNLDLCGVSMPSKLSKHQQRSCIRGW